MYQRTAEQRAKDFAEARAAEERVLSWLPDYTHARFDSQSELDYWVPGFYADLKQKKQHIGARWPLPADCPEEFAFIIDELSVRKGMAHYPHAYLFLEDLVSGRFYLARIDEVAAAEHVRVNRVGKGKWVLDLRNFVYLTDPGRQLWPAILEDQLSMAWKKSECQTRKDVPQV